MPPTASPQLVLASQSPRRASLLRDARFSFEQIAPPFDDAVEEQHHGEDPCAIACELAMTKARSLAEARDWQAPAILLGADTVCCGEGGRLLGKPASPDEAVAMIRGFVGRSHDVVSGIALLPVGDWSGVASDLAAASDTPGACQPGASNAPLPAPLTFCERAAVRFGPLDDATLAGYADSGDWRGKAGGYNLFDRQAAGWPITVDPQADATTVVGLPMRRLIAALAGFGIRPA